jgi:hypothetical protein
MPKLGQQEGKGSRIKKVLTPLKLILINITSQHSAVKHEVGDKDNVVARMRMVKGRKKHAA